MAIVVVESGRAPVSGAPLVPPNNKFASFSAETNHLVGMAVSPFTGSQQTYEFQGAFWMANITLPPMIRADAAKWQAFLLSCHGRANPFILGDPLATSPRGSALGISGVTIPSSQTVYSSTLATWGWTASQSNLFEEMDYFQIPRNYLQNPSAIDQSGWEAGSSTPTITADVTTAPDGAASADRIVFPSAASRWMQDFSNAPGIIEGQTFIFTVWLKAGSSITAQIRLRDVIEESPSDEEATSSNVSLTTTWQRFSVTRTMRAGVGSVWAEITNLNDNGSKTIYAWGACVYSITQDARLYACLANVNSDSSRNANIAIFPPLRYADSNIESCPIITTNPVGLFRLAANTVGWLEDVNRHYRDMSFDVVEYI